MIQNQSVLAVIPARGGSRGVPRKNLRILHGKPLIAWTIEAALHSKYVDRVVVSSDDAEIMAVAKKCGAVIPLQRPAALAADATPAIDAILHAVDHQPPYQLIVKLQPTSPLRSGRDIDESLEHMLELEADSVVSVCVAKHHPNWLKKVNDDGFLEAYSSEPLVSNRQQLPTVLALNGAIYSGKRDSLLRERSFHGDRCVGYLMDAMSSIDIDSELDFVVCEAILTRFGSQNRHGTTPASC